MIQPGFFLVFSPPPSPAPQTAQGERANMGKYRNVRAQKRKKKKDNKNYYCYYYSWDVLDFFLFILSGLQRGRWGCGRPGRRRLEDRDKDGISRKAKEGRGRADGRSGL